MHGYHNNIDAMMGVPKRGGGFGVSLEEVMLKSCHLCHFLELPTPLFM